mmetsp:Transcript_18143/g.37500  ORF Transcript_18143/g.37500 Transcript_18143/m.37500 type:complete len:117 (-) Transcript_18143:101-451(-)
MIQARTTVRYIQSPITPHHTRQEEETFDTLASIILEIENVVYLNLTSCCCAWYYRQWQAKEARVTLPTLQFCQQHTIIASLLVLHSESYSAGWPFLPSSSDLVVFNLFKTRVVDVL